MYQLQNMWCKFIYIWRFRGSRENMYEASTFFTFSLDESSVIPRIDKDAPLHIIKTKMKESPGGNASCKFKSGGPRPTVVAITPTAYKPSEEASKRTIRKRSSLINSNIFCHSWMLNVIIRWHVCSGCDVLGVKIFSLQFEFVHSFIFKKSRRFKIF